MAKGEKKAFARILIRIRDTKITAIQRDPDGSEKILWQISKSRRHKTTIDVLGQLREDVIIKRDSLVESAMEQAERLTNRKYKSFKEFHRLG